MSSTRRVGCLICIALATTCALADEPAAEKKLPFWELPKTTLDLRSLGPIDLKLISVPDVKRGLIVLQTGDVAPPIDFVPESAELKALVAEKDSGYQVIPKGLAVGAAPFGDRKYKIDKLPQAFSGLTLLQTKMGHKAIADANYSITVSSAKPCLVFLALDQRVMDTYSHHGIPGWLQEYAPTGKSIRTDEPIMAQTSSEFLVFVRKSAGGRIVFGPPAMDTQFNAMYFAFFGESKAE